ncbi:MAG: hypothetical protein MI924_00080, partial [Chloroflexales bacterium]|nr:hypothetical protein [Chloroflexales bacterium]
MSWASSLRSARLRLPIQGIITAASDNASVLVQRGATASTQDLAEPLAQILNDGTANVMYGRDRLLTDDGSAQTWYLGDALGSVGATLDGAGAVQGTVGYDPWGALQSPLRPPHAGEMTCSVRLGLPANCKMMVTAGWCIYGRGG